MRLPMSRLGKVALVLLVLALVVVGLPIGMPMAPCPQCVLPAGAWCLLVALLTVAAVVLAPDRTGGRAAAPITGPAVGAPGRPSSATAAPAGLAGRRLG
jgi:hypothetical protein